MKLLELVDKEFGEGRSRVPIGSGIDHTIYTSTDEPNIIYKLGPKRVVDTWYETFKSNPDIFPVVYKRGKTKVKLKNDRNIQTPKGYVELKAGTTIPIDYVKLEKLDTKKVEKEWDEMDMMFEDIMEIDDWGFLDFLIMYMTNTPQAKANGYDSDKTLNMIDTQVKELYPGLYPTFLNYIKLTDKIMSISKGVPDLHKYNFGYDKNGNLKCLDF